jgi:DNA gyrase subunit A
MGRTAGGVRGIKLPVGAWVISLIIADEGSVLTATENGYGKRTPVDDYPCHGRGGQGVISIQCNERNGEVIGAELVTDDDQIMLITDGGTLVRTRVEEISTQGRNTQGVRLIGLTNGEKLVGVERIVEEQGEEGDDEEDSEDA